MADTYEIAGPGGTFEIEADHVPTQAEILQAVRAHGDAIAAAEQERLGGPGAGRLSMPSVEDVGRFAGNFLNTAVVAPVKGVASAILHPINTAKGIVSAQVDQARQAADLAQQGRYSEAVGHGMAAALPVLGPSAAHAGEQLGSGDIAGGLGSAAGLLAPFAVKKILEVRRAGQAAKSDLLTREAEQQVAQQVLGPGNPAYRGRAQAIAPEILERKLSGGRLELQQAAEDGMADAAATIDATVQARGGLKAPVSAQDVIGPLRRRIEDLQDSNGVPLSDAAGLRVAALQKQILKIRGLAGRTGVIAYEDLKKIRDEGYRLADEARAYERAGNPSLSHTGWAARETGSAIRDAFAKRSPETAAANADYAFWKTLNDVLDPAVGRPKQTAPSQGVTGGMRTVGTVTGNLIGGKAGAFIGGVLLPWLKDRVSSPEWQLADAQSKMRLAEGMRRGDIGLMRSAMVKIGTYAKPTLPEPDEAP